MVKTKVVIKNPTGLHLKPAGLFCQTAAEFKCKISFVARKSGGNAKSVLSVLGARIKMGDVIELICEGEDEEEALAKMIQIIEDGLGE